MKRSLVLLPLLSLSSAFAQTENSEPVNAADPVVEAAAPAIAGSEEVQSISRFTPQGSVDLSLRTVIANSKTEIKNIANVSSKANVAEGIANYGMNSWLNIGLRASYLISKTNESQGTESDTSSGVQDPALLFTIQPVKQGEGRPFNMLVDVSYSPKLISEEYNNGGKGYSSTRTTVTLSRYTPSTEYGMAFSYRYNSEGTGKFKDGTAWDSFGYDGFWGAVYAQFRAADFFYFWGAVAFGQDSEQQQSWKRPSTGDWALQINSYNYTQLRAGIKFIVVPEVSFVSFDFENQKVNDGSGWIKNNATVNGNIEKLEATAFVLNWTYRL